MTRYIAFLRGVSPMNLRMPDLKRCLEAAGFTDVKTLLSSGNAAFGSRPGTELALARKIEKAMSGELDRVFHTIVRPAATLQQLIAKDPYAAFRLPANAKRIVTFLREPPAAKIRLPPEIDGARIFAVQGAEVFSAYVPSPKGPVFMALIERTFGENVTTRTWDTVRKCAVA